MSPARRRYNAFFAFLSVWSIALVVVLHYRAGAAEPVEVVDESHFSYIEAPPPPPAPRDISMEVIDRRKTSFRVCWTAPADVDGKRLHGFYTLKIARRFIDDALFNAPTYVSPDGYLTDAKIPNVGIVQIPTPPIGAPGDRQCSEFVGYIETGYFAAINVTRLPEGVPEKRNDS